MFYARNFQRSGFYFKKLPKKWILLHFNRLKLKNYLYLFVMEDPVGNKGEQKDLIFYLLQSFSIEWKSIVGSFCLMIPIIQLLWNLSCHILWFFRVSVSMIGVSFRGGQVKTFGTHWFGPCLESCWILEFFLRIIQLPQKSNLIHM